MSKVYSLNIERIRHHQCKKTLKPDKNATIRVDWPLARRDFFVNCCKLDVTSLYPAIMLAYRICSKKDVDHVVLMCLKALADKKIELKRRTKAGDKKAKNIKSVAKLLINSLFIVQKSTSSTIWAPWRGSPRYVGNFLLLMIAIIEDAGGVIVEADTDEVIIKADEANVALDVPSSTTRAFQDRIGMEGMYVCETEEKITSSSHQRVIPKK